MHHMTNTTEERPCPDCTAVCENCGCRMHPARVVNGLCSFCQCYLNDLDDPPPGVYLGRSRELEDALTCLAMAWEE